MDIRFQAGGADKWKADIALIPIREGEKITDTCPELDSAAPYLVIAPAMRDVSGRKDEIASSTGIRIFPIRASCLSDSGGKR